MLNAPCPGAVGALPHGQWGDVLHGAWAPQNVSEAAAAFDPYP